jgi:hypothetical protein
MPTVDIFLSALVYQVECDDVHEPDWKISHDAGLLDRIFKRAADHC